MSKRRVLVVSDSRIIAASIEKVLRFWGHEAEPCDANTRDGNNVRREVAKSYDCVLVDLDRCEGITAYIHLSAFETLPTIFFLTSRVAPRGSARTLGKDIAPIHSYLVNKYGNLLSQRFDMSTEEFLNNHFCNLLQLAGLLKTLDNSRRTDTPNPFRNVSRILTDFGLAEDAEVLSRLAHLDTDLCPDPKERELNRLKAFHAESSLLEKRMVADLITDNVRYLQWEEPTRKVLWIEDRPDRVVEYALSESCTEKTLRESITRCFSYYSNMSVFLLQTGFEQFFARLRQPPHVSGNVREQGGGLFHDLDVEQICGKPRGNDAFGLEDFEAVLLDLHFENENRISGQDLIIPLTEAAPGVPIVVFSKSRDPEVIAGVLRSGGDFYVNKSFPNAVPVFVNRCYDGDATNLFFIENSKLRLYLLNSRHDVRIRIDTSEELANKVAPETLSKKGAVGIAEGLAQREEKDGQFVFKTRNVFRWREVFIFTDEVEGLGHFVQFQGPNKQTVDEAVTHFELDVEERLDATYLEMYNELNCPMWLTSLRGFHAKFGEFVFGSTSGILTTIGMLLGVYVAVKEFSAVMASIAAVAASDSWSVAYSMYSAKLVERGTSGSEAFRHAFKTFLGKVLVPLLFMLVLWLSTFVCDSLEVAVGAVSGLGVLLLVTMSFERPLVAGEKAWGVAREVGKNVLLAFVVLLCSAAAGYGVRLLFG